MSVSVSTFYGHKKRYSKLIIKLTYFLVFIFLNIFNNHIQPEGHKMVSVSDDWWRDVFCYKFGNTDFVPVSSARNLCVMFDSQNNVIEFSYL